MFYIDTVYCFLKTGQISIKNTKRSVQVQNMLICLTNTCMHMPTYRQTYTYKFILSCTVCCSTTEPCRLKSLAGQVNFVSSVCLHF